ncbi:MAG TPA: hypothetical protein ENO20_05140 [Bacteroides sp.]|nr:hypothetical protein [Bacteroides sp.]
MKYFFTVAWFALIVMLPSSAQVHRVGGGLSFSSGVDFNGGETGNPGYMAKGWIGLDRRGAFHLVPSVTYFNRYKLETGYFVLTNHMLQGDLDAQYAVFREGTVKIIAFAGGNFTYLISDFEPIIQIGHESITDAQEYAFGGNLGAGLELRMAPGWDFIVSGKYLFSRYAQFIISVQGVYYFKRRRGIR